MRVLWLSNRAFSELDAGGSGTWLSALGDALVATREVEICCIGFDDVGALLRRDHGPIPQWLVPLAAVARTGIPPAELAHAVAGIARDLSPDLVHVWGSESFWGLLTARGMVPAPALLELQGLKEPCSRVYAGGLTLAEQVACLSLREVVGRGDSIPMGRERFRRWSRFEREIIAGHDYITTPSPWAESWARRINPGAHYAHTDLLLREAFYETRPWTGGGGSIFCSAAYFAPFKGLHEAIRAFALVGPQFPSLRLRIAGAVPRVRGPRREGYASWLTRLAARLGVADRIDWLGALPADAVVAELRRCEAALVPSHCESYCLALAEALYVGAPSVTTRTGGSDWLARDGESALFYTAGDHAAGAAQLGRVLADRELTRDLSSAARAAAVIRQSPPDIVAAQLRRYREVVEWHRGSIPAPPSGAERDPAARGGCDGEV